MSDDTPDEFVPDPQVRRELNINPMRLHRWERDPRLNFPPKIKIRGHNFRSRKAVEDFKQRMISVAISIGPNVARALESGRAKGREKKGGAGIA
jgi:hypothetical protein